ncbi:uncharacterized protein [Mytilus edulis]|uniref:uncharacterized protein n=1 Tax=Mytilus edulis TaxID=6550 RepID=UPI0039EFDE42
MLVVQLMLSDGGQECLSCSNIETVQDCQHYIVCDNTEVCYKQKFATESGGTSYDFGCSQPKTCNHLIGSIFGKRSEGHHIICSGCCNNTRLCNQDITCSNVKPNNTRVPQECSDINIKNRTDGVYTIYPDGQRATPVYCDMTTKNLSWTVIQRRINGFIDFYRGWSAYKDGFGDVNSEYWLGNDNIHEITSQATMILELNYKILMETQPMQNIPFLILPMKETTIVC